MALNVIVINLGIFSQYERDEAMAMKLHFQVLKDFSVQFNISMIFPHLRAQSSFICTGLLKYEAIVIEEARLYV